MRNKIGNDNSKNIGYNIKKKTVKPFERKSKVASNLIRKNHVNSFWKRNT